MPYTKKFGFMDMKDDAKQDKKLLKGKPASVKKAFKKADVKMDKAKSMTKKEDTKKDKGFLSKLMMKARGK